jgi:hypothetical protein
MRSLVSKLIAMVAALFFAGSSEAAPYAQLSSSQVQLGGATPKVVQLDQDDAVKGISNSQGLVTFNEAGAYFVMAAAQVGSADGKGQGTVRLWMRKNGRDVENSNSMHTIVPAFTAVLVSQGVLEIKAGDTMEMVYSVSTTSGNLGLIASTPEGEPMVPSMIFTAFKVDDSAYAQISSSESQMAATAGRPIMLNTVDAAKNIENKGGALTFKTAGTYFVMVAGQVGCDTSASQGRVRLWLLQNGLAVSNLNCEQTVSPDFTAVLVCQAVMACQAGDRLEFIQSASGSGMGMIASTPQSESEVPSVMVSIFKVADGAYAQLSSVESQPGASYEKLIRLNQTDAARNVENATRTRSSSINKGAISIHQDGVYFAMAAGQVGSTDSNGTGSMRMWLRKGGINVAKSNTEQTITGDYTAVLISQGVSEAKQGNRLQLFQSARGTGVGLISSTPPGEPAVPSIIFTLVKVD